MGVELGAAFWKHWIVDMESVKNKKNHQLGSEHSPEACMKPVLSLGTEMTLESSPIPCHLQGPWPQTYAGDKNSIQIENIVLRCRLPRVVPLLGYGDM
jgi:hypothetical protein